MKDDDDDKTTLETQMPPKPLVRIDLDVPDDVELRLTINGVEMELDNGG